MTYRPNAILFCGPPISHLPTARLFAYATHFDAHPLGLEWVSDDTCVFVFESKSIARTAQRNLLKSATEEADADEFVTAKSIPMALWPPEQRINATLGKGEGLKGTIRMRWAKVDDVKKKGAKKESIFYKKYGDTAGKEIGDERPEGPSKRRRMDGYDEENASRTAQELDDDLDKFLAENNDEPEVEPEPSSPPSKMYSDYIANDGKTLLERTSLIRAHSTDLPTDLASRITRPLPRRARNMESTFGTRPSTHDTRRRDGRRRDPPADTKGRSSRSEKRPKKSQQDLDDELEAFLKERD